MAYQDPIAKGLAFLLGFSLPRKGVKLREGGLPVARTSWLHGAGILKTALKMMNKTAQDLKANKATGDPIKPS